MENSTKFYPNVEYNQKKRNKYFTLFAVFTVIILLMDAWAIAEKLYWMLIVNAFWVLFIALIPKTLKENPTKRDAVLEVNKTEVTIMGKTIARTDIRWVKAIVYLGRVGNALEDRQFLEQCAAGKPLLEMFGSIEICYTGSDGKPTSEFATIENLVEALLLLVADGKISTYRLGYSLGKDYRVSTYNLKEMLVEIKEEKTGMKEKSKVKQLI